MRGTPRTSTRAFGYWKSGTAAEARSCPATSSMTMQPGSFAPRMRAVLDEANTPAKATRSPDIKSPAAAAKLGEATERARRQIQAAARASADPAVPGANGESPEPRPREKRVTTGDS